MPLETNKQQEKSRVTQADQKIGARLRQAREEAQLSQQSLADHIGVSFQQIQKYENGVNRVSVARLCMIAKITKQPLGFFCQDIDPQFYIYDHETLRLVTDYKGIPSKEGRTLLRNIAKMILMHEYR